MPGFDWETGIAAGEQMGEPIPSQYRTFVFVAPMGNLYREDGSRFHITPQEYLCHNDACAEVTTALYLTPDELSNPGVVASHLTAAVGLLRDPSKPARQQGPQR